MTMEPDLPPKERKDISIPLTLNFDRNKLLGKVRLDSRDHVNFDLSYEANAVLGNMLLDETVRELTIGYSGTKPLEVKPTSHMVEHALRELKLLGEDDVTIEWYLSVIQAYSNFGHSGGSAASTIPVLFRLLEQKNLRPLTDDPEEWMQHSADVYPPAGVWQNKRNSEAFSLDEGKTYWLVSENVDDQGVRPMHTSANKES